MHAIAEQVNDYIRAAGESVCDRCVKEALRLRHLSQVQQIAGALGTTREFIRGKGVCALCGKGKLVTGAAGTSAAPEPASPASAGGFERGGAHSGRGAAPRKLILHWTPADDGVCPVCTQPLPRATGGEIEVELRRSRSDFGR